MHVCDIHCNLLKNCHIITYFFRAGLNELYATSQKNLDVEMKLRQHLEQEIEVMRRLKEENEVREFGREREREREREKEKKYLL